MPVPHDPPTAIRGRAAVHEDPYPRIAVPQIISSRSDDAAVPIANVIRWFREILSGRTLTVRQNQRIIAFDACAPPLAYRLYRQSVQVATTAEAANLALRHQVTIALRRRAARLPLQGSGRALLVSLPKIKPARRNDAVLKDQHSNDGSMRLNGWDSGTTTVQEADRLMSHMSVTQEGRIAAWRCDPDRLTHAPWAQRPRHTDKPAA